MHCVLVLYTVAIMKLCCYRIAKLRLLSVELDYNVMKGTVVSLQLSVLTAAGYNITENKDAVIGIREHLTL